MSTRELSNQEYKKLVIKMALRISPIILQNKLDHNFETAEAVAIHARDIADAVNAVLRGDY